MSCALQAPHQVKVMEAVVAVASIGGKPSCHALPNALKSGPTRRSSSFPTFPFSNGNPQKYHVTNHVTVVLCVPFCAQSPSARAMQELKAACHAILLLSLFLSYANAAYDAPLVLRGNNHRALSSNLRRQRTAICMASPVAFADSPGTLG